MTTNKKTKVISENGFVFSTKSDFVFPEQEVVSEKKLNQKQELRIWLERLRGDKKATVIKGFSQSEETLEDLIRVLKKKCSCGGAVKNQEIILQGDVRKKAGEILLEAGYKFKLAGG